MNSTLHKKIFFFLIFCFMVFGIPEQVHCYDASVGASFNPGGSASNITDFHIDCTDTVSLGDTVLCSADINGANGYPLAGKSVIYRIYMWGMDLQTSGYFTDRGDGTYYFSYVPATEGGYLVYAEVENFVRTATFSVGVNITDYIDDAVTYTTNADFTYYNLVGNEVQFIDTSKTNSLIINWTWNISGYVTHVQHPKGSFDDSGVYTVNLTVTDVKNQTSSVQQNITVTAKSFTPWQFAVFFPTFSTVMLICSMYLFRRDEERDNIVVVKSIVVATISVFGWLVSAAISIVIGIPYEIVIENVVISDWQTVENNYFAILFLGLAGICGIWLTFLVTQLLHEQIPLRDRMIRRFYK